MVFTTLRVCVFLPSRIALTIGPENRMGRSFTKSVALLFIIFVSGNPAHWKLIQVFKFPSWVIRKYLGLPVQLYQHMLSFGPRDLSLNWFCATRVLDSAANSDLQAVCSVDVVKAHLYLLLWWLAVPIWFKCLSHSISQPIIIRGIHNDSGASFLIKISQRSK